MLYDILGFSDNEFPAGLGWHDKIHAGFPQGSLWSLSRYLGVNVADTADLVGVPVTELSWRLRSQLVSSPVSDRLFNLAKAFQRLMVPLKEEQLVQTWLRTAQPSLGHRIPVLLLVNQPGSLEVFEAIDAIKVTKTVEMTQLEDEDLPEPTRESDEEPQMGPDGDDDEVEPD
jgi:putative toxin-antitoxin system antitoxin component (TIGR02293 family)